MTSDYMWYIDRLGRIYVNDLVGNLCFHSELFRRILSIVYITFQGSTMFIRALFDKMA